MKTAIGAVRQAFLANHRGELAAPPRHSVSFGGRGALVFTIGGDAHAAGFRVYDTFPKEVPDTQMVAVWDVDLGSLTGVVLGRTLGDMRTGAIGGLAIDLMARADAHLCAIIGSGRQARTQLMAAAEVRDLHRVQVFSRDGSRCEASAREMGSLLGLPVEAVGGAQEAVEGADLVICATGAGSPVLEASWLSPGTHVTTVGPKFKGRHETSVETAARADLIVTDAPAQIRAYPSPFFLAETPHMARVGDLADLVAQPPEREAEAIGLFCSTGLAGTEVFVARALVDKMRG